jgi:hypothetical protein
MIMNALQILTPLTTLLALALAVGMGAALIRLLREERRRSDARVAALVDAAGDRGADVRPRQAEVSPVDFDLRAEVDVAGVSDMFVEPERSSPWGRRIAVAAGVAAIVTVAGYVLLSRDTTMADTTAPAAAAQTQGAPLELLSLRHTQQPGTLTITGLVQNPRSGVALSRVTATAFLFSEEGTFLASGRAPLDFSTIGPGDESPFVVTVSVTGSVARYRVGFRGEDGRVIAHVDRRASGTMASRN